MRKQNAYRSDFSPNEPEVLRHPNFKLNLTKTLTFTNFTPGAPCFAKQGRCAWGKEGYIGYVGLQFAKRTRGK